MSDFGQMAGQLARLGTLQAKLRVVGDVTTETGHIRQHLLDGPKSTQELERLTGLSDKQIWGRFKNDLKKRTIVRDAQGRFELNVPDDDEIQQAIGLLRRSGYTVTKNKDRACTK